VGQVHKRSVTRLCLKRPGAAMGKGMQIIESAYELDEEGILEGVNRQQRLIMMKSIWKS
jgi:hypothetical protein